MMIKLLAILPVVMSLLGPAAGWRDRQSAQVETLRLKSMLSSNTNREGGPQLQEYFSQWARQHGRQYAGAPERAQRFAQFREGLKDIVRINEDPTTTFWAAPNKFTDLSFEEFSASYLGAVVPPGIQPQRGPPKATGRKLLADEVPPSNVDWRLAGKVTPVREQGQCAGCWAFTAVAALESAYLIKYGQEVDFSEQQLIDCVTASAGFLSKGCNGGWATEALEYVAQGNITTEGRYPYTGATGACNSALLAATTRQEVARMKGRKGYRTLPSFSVDSLMKAVSRQPVISAINVNADFMHYAGGVYSASSCSDETVNHAVLAVGYSTGSGIGADDAFWVFKNSWGANWGEQGYGRVQMTGDGPGACGMYRVSFLPSPLRGSKKALNG